MQTKNRQINTKNEFSPKKEEVTLTFKKTMKLDGLKFNADEPKTITRSRVKAVVHEALSKHKEKCIISMD